jgi:hypothetical protein
MVDFLRTVTVLLGLIPFTYGGLTWLFGIGPWIGSPIYATALAVPYAPQSWGTVFLLLGIATIVSGLTGRHRCVLVSTILTALALSMFMVTFAEAAMLSSGAVGLPPAVVYGVLSLLFLTRARLAWLSVPRRRR